MTLSIYDIAAVAAVIGGILSIMGLVRRLAIRFDLSPELQRKLVHVATGTVALSFPLLFASPLPVFVLSGCSIAIMMLLRRQQWRGSPLSAVLHDVARTSRGDIFLALAIAVIFALSRQDLVLYILPMLIVTLADPAAAIIGINHGRRRFPVGEGAKSIEGVIAFFAVAWCAAMIVLPMMTGISWQNAVLLSILVAAFCALIEAECWNGWDNLCVPVGAYVLLSIYITADAFNLMIAIIFVSTAVFLVPLRFAAYKNLRIATLVLTISTGLMIMRGILA